MLKNLKKQRYNNKKAISQKTDGFGPSGESRTHGLLNPMEIGKPVENHGISRISGPFKLQFVAVFVAVF